jgi:hypothetical protein
VKIRKAKENLLKSYESDFSLRRKLRKCGNSGKFGKKIYHSHSKLKPAIKKISIKNVNFNQEIVRYRPSHYIITSFTDLFPPIIFF